MNIDRINQWLTLLANFGVLRGIIFLALEIQQNTTAVQASAIQESTNVARQQILMFATNADLNRLNMMNLDELNPEEKERMRWVSRSYWLGMQGLYRQWRMGVLPDEEWLMWNKVICSNYSATRFWPQTLIPSFIEFVESCDSRGNTDTESSVE